MAKDRGQINFRVRPEFKRTLQFTAIEMGMPLSAMITYCICNVLRIPYPEDLRKYNLQPKRKGAR